MEKQQLRTAQALKAHLALNVRSVERSVEFYQKMLGLEPAKRRPGYAKFDVQNPPLNLTLNEVPFAARGALSHLGIQLATTEDVLAMRRNWLDAGLDTRDEMQTNCCYALQNKTWVQDPDGNEWEAFVVLEDNLPVTTTCCVPESNTTSETATESPTACAPTTTAEATTTATPTEATTVLTTALTAEAATTETATTAEASSCCAAAAPLTISR